jgi:transcriptional regulator with XRE-family HTH domain
MEFSERLTKVLEKRGISQQQFAEECGLSKAAVSRYIAGERQPSYEALLRMKNVLGSWNELLG